MAVKSTNGRNNFMMQKFMGNPTKLETLFGYTRHPQRERHTSFTTLGPYKVIKKVSDATYRIQHLYGNQQCKVIHFDRLKPCSREVIQSLQHSRPMPVEPTIDQSTCHSSQDLIGSSLELLDDYDDDAELQLPLLSTADSVRRYPTRTHRPPNRFGDFVRH